MMIRANGIIAAAFAGYAWGIALAFARVVLRNPPWGKKNLIKWLKNLLKEKIGVN